MRPHDGAQVPVIDPSVCMNEALMKKRGIFFPVFSRAEENGIGFANFLPPFSFFYFLAFFLLRASRGLGRTTPLPPSFLSFLTVRRFDLSLRCLGKSAEPETVSFWHRFSIRGIFLPSESEKVFFFGFQRYGVFT